MPDRASRFIAWALRHAPDEAGITLDPQGWAAIPDLLHSLQRHGYRITGADLTSIVAADPKGRYVISPDGRRIRANYAHSVAVDLGTPATIPPELLFHGTARDHLASIKRQGLLRGTRQFVHLATDIVGAFAIGRRHGPAVVIPVDSKTMSADGLLFHQGSPLIWQTVTVPPCYLRYDALMFD